MKLTLIKTKQETSDVCSFLFQPEQPIDWIAGQYMRYHLDNPKSDDRGENRFFTISSSPNEKYIQLTTRINTPGSTFKNQLIALKPGDQIDGYGPNGKFVIEDPLKQYVFIAGGIGITPMRSIIADLDFKKLPINITLLYANRNKEIVFQRELEKIAKRHPEFSLQYFIGEHTPDLNFLQPLTSIPHPPTFYISGPELMMKNIISLLKDLGVSEEIIKHDFFPGYE